MIKVLHELSSLDGGGVAKLLYDYYLHMDREKIRFDFLIYDYYDKGIYEEPLRKLGCNIYVLPVFKRSKRECLRQMRDIIHNGNYDIVHSHRGSRGLFVLWFAKQSKVAKRIVHSHIAYEPVGHIKMIENKILSFICTTLATDLYACGKDAGVYMWGKKNVLAGNVSIMTNAIDTAMFRFSQTTRQNKRKELNLKEEPVVGIVGRLSPQKNYPFLFRVFKQVLTQIPNAKLLVVGRGDLENELKAEVNKMALSDSVLFLGVRDDVNELLCSMDVFVLPSLYEGLPVVLIEEQANGLPAIISDRITDEMNVTDLIKVLPISGDNSEEIWSDIIVKTCNKSTVRDGYADKVKESGYDIVEEAKKMQEFYCNGR
ncbi:MAG: glycosyltransferase family 1 protein [Oscillospiraceae bacterium]|nr:glycosyltransferase family 1 protein [Oscillospiraceae bacterium]